MKAAILTNRDNSYHRPLAEGLSRMFKKINVESIVLYEGLSSLPRKHKINQSPDNRWKYNLRLSIQMARSFVAYHRLVRKLRSVDLLIIVNHMPGAYLDTFFDDKRLRNDLPTLPIILYDLVYLPSRGSWAKHIYDNLKSMGVTTGRHFGIDRYDYHLCVTEVSEFPVPPQAEDFSRIGINLEDPSLLANPNKSLIALIDFERPNHLHERAIQVQACVEAGIPFKVLHGHYTIEQIRSIYQSCSLFFIAHRESFGLPICEVQACGGLVFTPYFNWCPSHYLETPKDSNAPVLPENFFVYDNDKTKLVEKLEDLKKSFNAYDVLANFQRDHPHFFYGDMQELKRFIDRVKDGSINSQSHKHYPSLGELVQLIKIT